MPLDELEIEILRRRAENSTDEDQLVEFTRLDSDDEGAWASAIKEVVAFANTDGGIIMFGCDSRGNPDPGPIGYVDTVDSAEVAGRLYGYTKEPIDFVKRIVPFRGTHRCAWFVARNPYLIVFPDDKEVRNPSDSEKPIIRIRKGTVYFRHTGESAPAFTSDLRKAIDDRVNRLLNERKAMPYSAAAPTETNLTVTPGVATTASSDGLTSSGPIGPASNAATSKPGDMG